MKLFQCSCRVAQLTRLKRPLWLRIIPFMRLCFCRNCKRTVFIVRSRDWWPYFVYTYYRRRSAPPGWEDTRPMLVRSSYRRYRRKGV
jgi:hypothetical protein